VLRIHSAVLPLFILALCQPGFAQTTTPTAPNDSNAGVVVITGTDADGNTRLGSGFVVETTGTVVTTYRTLRGLAKANVRLANGDVHDIEHVRAFDAAKNIAIVQVRAFGLAAAQLGDSESVGAGSKLVLHTNAANASPAPSVATTAIERLPEGFRILTLSPELDPVHNGTPLSTDAGAIVAMVASRATAPTAAPIGVPINYVRALLSVDEKLSLADLSGSKPPVTLTPSPAITTAPAATATAPTGGTQTGTVVFYRIRRFVGSALEPSVYCNDQELANMDNGRYFRAALTPGPYVCRSTDSTVVSFDLSPGETRYMRVEILTGFMKGHGVLREVPPKQGEIEIQKLKPADADHIKAATLADR
jgi:hypothetical protein